ncbi:MAG: hypothetical protein ACOX3E_10590 [Desulfomonilia bacterium]
MNLRPEAVGEIVQEETLFIGNGVRLYREVLRRTLGRRFREGPEHLWYPRASVLARMALSQVSRGVIEPVQPLYVRPSECGARPREDEAGGVKRTAPHRKPEGHLGIIS